MDNWDLLKNKESIINDILKKSDNVLAVDSSSILGDEEMKYKISKSNTK